MERKKRADETLKVTEIIATTVDDAWFQCLLAVVKRGYVYLIDQGSYAGQYRLQLRDLNLVVKFPWMEPRIPLMPEGSSLPPPVDKEYIDNYLPYLLTAEKQSNEDYTYGQFLNGWNYFKLTNGQAIFHHIDQVKTAVQMIANNPGNNQTVMSVCNPESLLLEDPPCLRQIQLQVIDGQLRFILFWRSWDLCIGLPGNLAVIQILKEMMLFDINHIRKLLNKKEFEDGPIIAKTAGGHIYDHTFDIVEQRLQLESGSIEKTHGLK